MKGYHTNIEEKTLQNTHFRQVLYTAKNIQLVLMTLQPLEDIGEEIHPDNDQFFRFESGEGVCVIDDNKYIIKADDIIIVPAGAKHNIINTSNDKPLKMYTIYGPSHHKDQIVRETKEDAMKNEAEFDGITTE